MSETPPSKAEPPDPHDNAARFENAPYDLRDPNPWLAMYLDQSLPMDRQAKAALVLDLGSFSRQFVLPVVRPFARLAIILIQLLKIVTPRAFAAPLSDVKPSSLRFRLLC